MRTCPFLLPYLLRGKAKGNIPLLSPVIFSHVYYFLNPSFHVPVGDWSQAYEGIHG